MDRFDSSVGRGDFVTRIGVGQVIKGKKHPRYSEATSLILAFI